MLKTLPLAALALALAAGAAQAGDHHRSRVAAGAPQPIADVAAAGAGTTTGTVSKVAATWFTMSDGRDQIDVTTKGFLPEGLQPGQQVTVTGGVRQGAIRAGQIIRDDGTAFGCCADRQRREGRDRHDDGD
ncbi:cytochrome c maturation protein CcmE [Azospirillum sp. ST 5-10]|uniref:cytochrome c maturation protein CcmE n=1 Tax=unclassified Azospirillum TaxID=2630922 RepID=UPI003F4A01C8